jgi:hypothetical protein
VGHKSFSMCASRVLNSYCFASIAQQGKWLPVLVWPEIMCLHYADPVVRRARGEHVSVRAIDNLGTSPHRRTL